MIQGQKKQQTSQFLSFMEDGSSTSCVLKHSNIIFSELFESNHTVCAQHSTSSQVCSLRVSRQTCGINFSFHPCLSHFCWVNHPKICNYMILSIAFFRDFLGSKRPFLSTPSNSSPSYFASGEKNSTLLIVGLILYRNISIFLYL